MPDSYDLTQALDNSGPFGRPRDFRELEPPAEEMTGGAPQPLSEFTPTSAANPAGQPSPTRQPSTARGAYQLPQIYNAGVLQTGPQYSPQQRQQLVSQGYTPDQINQLSQGATTMPLASAANQRAQRLAQVQQTLQTQELSQADKQKLQQMLTGMSGVQSALNNGTLLPHEADELFLQLQSGIDPLQHRERAAQLATQQTQQQQRQQELNRQLDEADLRRRRSAAGLPDNVRPVSLGEGRQAFALYDDKGTPHFIDPRHIMTDGPEGHTVFGQQGAGSSGTTGTSGSRNQVTGNRLAHVLEHVERSVDAELKAEFKDTRPADYEDQRHARVTARLPRAIEHFRTLESGLNPPPVNPEEQPLSAPDMRRLETLRGRNERLQDYQRRGEQWPGSPEETQHWTNELQTLERRHGLQHQRGFAERVGRMRATAFGEMQGAQEEVENMRRNQDRVPPHERNLQDLQRRAETYAQQQVRFRVVSALHQLLRTKAKHTWTQQDTMPIRQMLRELNPASRREIESLLE